MARYFVPITVEELQAKIVDAAGPGYCSDYIYNLVANDLIVDFGVECISQGRDVYGTDVTPFRPALGYRTEPTELTYCGFCACTPPESPVYFAVYWDGQRLRGYVPRAGNPWNSISHEAYGNDERLDLHDLTARWPGRIWPTAEEYGYDVRSLVDPEAIRGELVAALLPRGPRQPGGLNANTVG